jgi:hypothetical protein
MARVVEHLPSKHKVLSSKTGMEKKERERHTEEEREKEKRGGME